MSLNFVYNETQYALTFVYAAESQQEKVWLPIRVRDLAWAQTNGLKTRRTVYCVLSSLHESGSYATTLAEGQSQVLFDPKRATKAKKAGTYWPVMGYGNDSYNKGLGRKKALTDCLGHIQDKGLRTAAWQAYNTHTDKQPKPNLRERAIELLAGLYLEVFFGDLLKQGCQVRLEITDGSLDSVIAVPKDRPDLVPAAEKQVNLFKEALHAALASTPQTNPVAEVQPNGH